VSAPYEQEWERDEHRAGVIHATDAITVEIKVAFWRIPGGDAVALEQAEKVEALAIAAPDTTRALLRHGRFGGADNAVWHTHECWMNERAMCDDSCKMDRAALRKAGVIP